MAVLGSFIDGAFVKEGPTESRNCVVTGINLATLHLASPKALERGLLLSNEIETLSCYERMTLLQKIAARLLKEKEALAHLIVSEMGKTLKEARSEVEYTASYFSWFAGEAIRIYGTTIASPSPSKKIELRYFPVGPCAIITPWNFPLAMGGRKIAPALAAGCPVAVKPAPETPLSMLRLAEIIHEEGAPPGTCNVLIGDETSLGERLTTAPHIRKISFTGSSEIGALVYQNAAKHLKKVTLELGGNAPFIVSEDADLTVAVKELIAAKIRGSGQTCICANRVLVHEKIYDSFAEKLQKALAKLTVGNPFKETTDISEILHPQSKTKMKVLVEDALSHGGKQLEAPIPLLRDVSRKSRAFSEEIFAPVIMLYRFSSDEEAIKLANDTRYGLASYLCTSSLARAERYIRSLQFGMIGINDGAISTPSLPFGGIKDSGFGKEGGPTGIYEYLIGKAISIAP